MALNIKSPEADRLARELAARTGESITEAVTIAIRQRLERARRPTETIQRNLAELRQRAQQLEVVSNQTGDDILGYNDDGLPT